MKISIPEPYPITVDYHLSLQQMIEAGHYDRVNPSITQENFPVVKKRLIPQEAVLVHFNRLISTTAVLAELDHQGLRPGDLAELLALGEEHPDLQRQFPIVELASVWANRDGYRCVAYLWGSADERSLRLLGVVGDWSDSYRFLAFRKP